MQQADGEMSNNNQDWYASDVDDGSPRWSTNRRTMNVYIACVVWSQIQALRFLDRQDDSTPVWFSLTKTKTKTKNPKRKR